MTLSINPSTLPYVPASLLSGTSTADASALESSVTQNTDPLLQTQDDNEELLNALDGTSNTSSTTEDPLLQASDNNTNDANSLLSVLDPSSNLGTYNASGSLNSTTNPSLLNYLG